MYHLRTNNFLAVTIFFPLLSITESFLYWEYMFNNQKLMQWIKE